MRPREREWQQSELGDVFVLTSDCDATVGSELVEFHPGDVIVSLGQLNIHFEMLYMTSKGVGGFINDETFYLHEVIKIESPDDAQPQKEIT